MFKHYILCRYNHRLFSDNPYNIADPEAWMLSRLPLFVRLLRSLANQTNSEFSLLLTIDPHTPRLLRGPVEEALNESGVPVTILDVSPMEWLKSREPEADYLLTSRIDNDDEYLPGFVDAVQAECSRGTEILDVRGVQCDGKSYYSIKRAQPNSPFLSLLEPWHDVKTAHFVSHTTMTQFFPARFVGPEILYIQHVHSSNVLNKITGKRLRLDDLTNLPPLPEPSNISDIASALRQPLRYLAQRRSAAPKSG